MNHGRSLIRRKRAPVPPAGAVRVIDSLRSLGGAAPSLTRGAAENPLRIGPPVLADSKSWHESGVRQECNGDTLDAIQSYYQALAIGGPDVQIVFDLAYALAAVGQFAAAMERYRQVIELDATRQDAWVNLGLLQAESDDLPAAIESLRHAVRLDPSDPAAHYDLADLLDSMNVPEAVDHWRAYTKLATAGTTAHLERAWDRLRQQALISRC